jgi:DNA-binding GntR family transcriptional regulator
VGLKVRGSLTERVTERLRQAILEGEVELGDALSEDKLATILGVSRSPVREALAALEQQGLIDVRPQRGSFVFLPTSEDTQNLCEFRKMVETEALRLSIRHRKDETLAAMKVAAQTMQTALEAGHHLQASKADDEFHAALLENCGNPYLIEAYRLVSGKVAALRLHRSNIPTRNQANLEHFAIIAMLEAGDIDAAAGELASHILKMRERYNVEVDAPRLPGGRAARSPTLDHIGPLED